VHHDFAAAAIDRRPGLDAQKTVPARGGLVLLHFEAADDTLSMQPLVMMPELVDIVVLFLSKVPFNEKFSREVVVPLEWRDRTLRAA